MCERLLLQSIVHSKVEMRLSSNTQRVRTFGCSISTVRCSRGAEDDQDDQAVKGSVGG